MATEVKGGAILSRLQYIEENGGQAILEKILARLDPAFRSDLEKGLFQDLWYPLDLYIALNRAICDHFGGDDAMLIELGRHSAKSALSTIFGAFYQKGKPEYLFEKAQWVWSQYYSTGRLEVTRVAARHYRFTIHDFEQPQREVCLTVLGWMEQNVEFSGGQDIQARELGCRANGDDRCELEVIWS